MKQRRDDKNLTIPLIFWNSHQQNPQKNALSMVEDEALTYDAVYQKVNQVIGLLKRLNIEKGDKVALLSKNIPNWGIVYLAVTSMGAVVIPILPDFSNKEIENILVHSESKAVFFSDNHKKKIVNAQLPDLNHLIKIEDFSVLDNDIQLDNVSTDFLNNALSAIKPEETAAIIYTSGTTGKSKGVMLSHRNITFNAAKGMKVQPMDESDRFLSILPMSHTYENTLGFILPLMAGAAIYYIDGRPTSNLLLPALSKIKPTVMLTVPLIIEKIYRTRILPGIREKRLMNAIYRFPFFRKKIHRLAGKKLLRLFGGSLRFYGIGGAKLDFEVERFLYEANFPYAIGYGLTETSPLLAGVNPQTARVGSTGPAIEDVSLKINEPDIKTGEGEIWAKGPNIMQGYYKDLALTNQVITPDGWFKTGDLGIFDKDKYLYIKGRLKNVIIGSNGENIHPEEIESIINNFRYVVESLVIEKKGKLVAMVHFNKEEIEKKYQHFKVELSNYLEVKLEELSNELHEYINSQVNKFSKVEVVILQPNPFEKTATQKIKRFLYT